MRIDRQSERAGAVIVTGAGGARCGRAIARDGHAALVTDLDERGCDATVEAIRREGGEANARRVDVRDADQRRDAVEECATRYGGV
jgi:NADP-dependent 3-hydroxy acid dehydrogenase YdfG